MRVRSPGLTPEPTVSPWLGEWMNFHRQTKTSLNALLPAGGADFTLRCNTPWTQMEAAGRRVASWAVAPNPGSSLGHQLTADNAPSDPADSEAERAPEGTMGCSRHEGRPGGCPEQRRRSVTHLEALLPGPALSQIRARRRLLRPLLPGSPVPSPGQRGARSVPETAARPHGEQSRWPCRITTADADELRRSGFCDAGSGQGPRAAPCTQAHPSLGTELPLSTCRQPQHLQALMVNRPIIFLDGSFPL